MANIKSKFVTGLSLIMAGTAAAALCAAGTTAFAAIADEPLVPGGNVLVAASAADSAKITLQDTTAGTYLLGVEPWAYDMSIAEPLVATVDDGDAETPAVTKTLVSNVYMYGAYTAEFDLSPETTSLVITTGSEETIDLSVTLYAPVTTTPLPVDGASATLTQYTEYNFSYEFTGVDGYYGLSWTSNTADAGFDITAKDNPIYLMGSYVQGNDYPLYLKKGNTYFFSVTYTGVAGKDIKEADISFSLNTWSPLPIRRVQGVYAPITPENEAHIIIPFGTTITKPDTYLLRLNAEPVYPEGTVVTAHIVNDAGQQLSEAISEYNNLYEVNLPTNAYGVYFTSDYTERFVGSVVAEITPSETVNFTVGTPARVSVKSGEALTCFLTNVTESGSYDIELLNMPATSSISVTDAYGTIVPAGGTSGTFAVVLEYPTEYGYPGETTKNAALTFQNSSDGTVVFYVLITKSTTDYNVTLGTATTLRAPAHSSITYYVPGLTGTNYLAEFAKSGEAADGNAIVYDYFDRYEPLVFADKPYALYSFGNITLEEGRTLTYAFVVVNNSDTDNEFIFTFTEVNTILVGADAENHITVDGSASADYYIGGITTGRYMITLSDISEGANFTISYNNTDIAFDENHVGYFVVDVPLGQVFADVKLTITNKDEQPVTFNAVVVATTDGTMTLGEPQAVTLGNNDRSETYAINLDANVEYTATITGTLPANVSVYAIVNGNYVYFENGTATILLDTPATTIEFTYFYDGTISFTFNVTIDVA